MDRRGDYVLSVLDVPRRLLTFLSLYPENLTRFAPVAFWSLLSCAAFMQYGQTHYMFKNVSDLRKMADACTTVATTFQAMCKLIILFANVQGLRRLLRVVRTQFWPEDIAGPNVRNSVRTRARIVKFNMYLIYGLALVFAGESIVLAAVSNDKRLPFASELPFNWSVSPIYEILFAFQVLTDVVINITSILGHDFLFYALTVDLVSQFELLEHVFGRVGSEDAATALLRIGDDHQCIDHVHVRLLRRCVQHHTILLRCCDDLERVFSATVFVQYAASASAICVSTFLITMIEGATVSHLVSYCFGHVCQLFFFCALGAELRQHTAAVADGVFRSKWYEDPLLKDVVFVIHKAQNEKRITALGLTELDYVSFIKVLRLSFSFYTLLHTIQLK